MNPVVHFEMPYENRDRMVDFYAKTFGWEANKLGPDMGDYVVVMTSETDPATKRPKSPGVIDGGLYKRSKDNRHPSVVISVPDITAAMRKVEDAGGTIIGASKGKEPDMIPGVGLYVAIEDTEGNRVSLLEPRGM